MAYRLFEGKEHASSYWKYRISPSDHLIEHVLDFLEKQVWTNGGGLLFYKQINLLQCLSLNKAKFTLQQCYLPF